MLIGIPSLISDLKTWLVWLDLANWEWWNYLFVSAGILLLMHATFQLYERFKNGFSKIESKNTILVKNQFLLRFLAGQYEKGNIQFLLTMMALPFMFFGLVLVTFGPFLLFLWLLEIIIEKL